MKTAEQKLRTNGDRDRFRLLEEVFCEAVELPTGQRREFIDARCASDNGLRLEVSEMLDSARHAHSFLGESAFSAGIDALADELSAVPAKIGGYAIINEIGRGGMGAVYLAEREDFQHRVALKVIKRGMDTDEIVRRFRQERDILASLKHPNIARLLDGGTTDDGRPFYVMEYIDGLSITRYCDRERLSIDDRLRLFRKVCSAVSYAHANLVIHRDIKPSNILIDANGEPKLLDFGISKVLVSSRFGTDAASTLTGMRMLTPEYASPEQVLGDRVTTAADIYSLGVLLFELLSGHRPFDLKDRSVNDLVRILSEREPTAPSTAAVTAEPVDNSTGVAVSPDTIAELRGERPERLRRRLKGDLDNIVLMALRKDPEMRYGSVDQFSEDISRHLGGLPVIARPNSFAYAAGKFIERHRLPAMLAGIAMLSIVMGAGVASWQAYQANIERGRAERRFNEIRQLANNLVSGWDKDIPETQITDVVRGRIADISTEYINNLADETNDPELLKELIRANIKVGHDYAYASFEVGKARERLNDAVTLSRRLVAYAPDDLEAKRLLKDSLAAYSEAVLEFDPEVLENTRERAELLEQISIAKPDDLDAFRNAAFEIAHFGGALRSFGRDDEAAVQQRRALAMNLSLVERYGASGDERDRVRLASTLTSMAERVARDLNDPQGARSYALRAVAAADGASDANPDDSVAAMNKESAYQTLAMIERQRGDITASDIALNKVVETARKANSISVTSFSVRKEYDALIDLAMNRAISNDRVKGTAFIEAAIAARKRFTSLPTQINSASSPRGNALLYLEAANVYRRMGMEKQAEGLYRRAITELNDYLRYTRPNGSDIVLQSDLLLAFGDQLSGVAMCTQNPTDYRDTGRYDRYCPPQEYAITTRDVGRLTEAADLYDRSAKLTDGLIALGATANHVMSNSRTAAQRLALINKR